MLLSTKDFAFGAMENWGLVTYRYSMWVFKYYFVYIIVLLILLFPLILRERLLLVNESSSTITKQLVALVVGE